MLKYFFQAMEGKLIDDRYRLISLLGEGGIGFVARAEQVSVGREVAIKFLSRAAGDHEQVARFKREARALAMLRHPACLTLHDFDYSAELECYYMVTELVEGVEFGEAVNEGMPLSEALLIMSHVCEALAYAHEQGILHRDLKPQNVMVTGSHAQPVKLLDFGLARLYQSTFGEEDYKVSRTGHVYGTPAYMSPEQCMASEDIGPASDVYSLGVMLYELCSGRLPFEKGTMTQILMSHIVGDITPLDEPELPLDLLDLVNRMLQKSPEDRPEDLYEVRSTLEDVAFRLMAQPSSPSSKTPPALEAPHGTPSEVEEQGFFTAPADHPTFEGVPSDSLEGSFSLEPEPFLLADEAAPSRSRAIAMAVAAVVLISLSAVGLGLALAQDDATPAASVSVRTLEPIVHATSPVRRVQSVSANVLAVTSDVDIAPEVEPSSTRTDDAPEARPREDSTRREAPRRDAPTPRRAKPTDASKVDAAPDTVGSDEVEETAAAAGGTIVPTHVEQKDRRRAKTLSFD